jgi:ribosomal protein S12 methylthiotransferase accessory factor
MSRPQAIETLRQSLRELKRPSLDIDVSSVGGLSKSGRDQHDQRHVKRRILSVRLTATRVHLALFSRLVNYDMASCPSCLDSRMTSLAAEAEQWYMQSGQHEMCTDSAYLLPSSIDSVIMLAYFLLDKAPNQEGCQKVYSLDLLSQAIGVSELMPDSFCERCSDWSPPYVEPYELPLRDSLVATVGTSRMVAPLDYKLPSSALVNPVCGTVAASIIPGYKEAVTAPVFGQYIQRTRNGARPHVVGWSAVCTCTEESRVVGMLEALERQAGMWAMEGRTPVTASYRELGDRAMDPQLSFAYNDESYSLPFGITRYDEDVRIGWVWGYSLVNKRSVLVPEQLVSYARIPKGELKLVNNNSSGCALGSCYEEATLKGLLELVERDSFVITWHRQLSLPKILPSSCTDFKTSVILDRLDHLGIDMSLLDARLDLGCPAVIAVARRRDGGVGSMAVGAAAAINPTEAISGALLEAATLIVELPGLIHVQEQHIRELAADHYKIKTVMEHALLYGLPEMASQVGWIDANTLERPMPLAFPANREESIDIAANLQRLVTQLVALGLNDIVVVDQTTREQALLSLKTVRVVVPGLAPLDFGYPRNRVEKLPRLQTAYLEKGLSPGNQGRLNALPHPFP